MKATPKLQAHIRYGPSQVHHFGIGHGKMFGFLIGITLNGEEIESSQNNNEDDGTTYKVAALEPKETNLCDFLQSAYFFSFPPPNKVS